MKIADHDIGVCSWSFNVIDVPHLVRRVREVGLSHVQLALGWLLDAEAPERQRHLEALRHSGLILTAGMIGFAGEDYTAISTIRQTGGFVPDDLWPARRDRTLDAGRLAAEIGITRVSTHIGFIPSSGDPHYTEMLDRVREVAKAYAELELTLLLETGQEQASALLQFLNDLAVRNVAVNFDPGNMILYGAGDPIEAVGILGRHIGHVHLKDAILSDKPGTHWGREVPFGKGQVGVEELLDALDKVNYSGPLIFEQEADEARLAGFRESLEALRAAEADAA